MNTVIQYIWQAARTEVAMERSPVQNKKDAWGRHVRIYRVISSLLDGLLKSKFNFTCEKPDMGKLSGPVIVIANHSCAWDPIFMAAAMKKRHMYFVASEHILRWKVLGPVLNYLVEPIPRKKASSGAGTVMMCLRHLRAGHSVCLFAEGEQAWNGITRPIVSSTGKMVSKSGATLITYRIEGAYLSLPRWAKKARKGRVHAHPVGIYPPEVLKGMKPEEINAVINRDIYFNTWEWQESLPGGPAGFRIKGGKSGLAERLEKSVFTCPECGNIGTLSSAGDKIRCSCGVCIRYTETGFFDPPTPFRCIPDWEAFDRKEICRIADTAKAEGMSRVLFEDEAAVLTKIGEGHTGEDLGSGRLALESAGGKLLLKVAGHSFDLEDISIMALVLSNILLFSEGKDYCQIYSNDANLRKYLYMWEYIRDNGLLSS